MTALAYRLAVASDLPLIRQGFLDSYRTAHAAGMISMENWHRVMAAELAIVLARPGTRVHVAYHPEEDSHLADLYGFIITEVDYCTKGGRSVPFVFYVYIKHNFRKKYGICKGLFAAAGVDPLAEFHFACKTGVVSKYDLPDAKWKPLPMRFPPAAKQL